MFFEDARRVVAPVGCKINPRSCAWQRQGCVTVVFAKSYLLVLQPVVSSYRIVIGRIYFRVVSQCRAYFYPQSTSQTPL